MLKRPNILERFSKLLYRFSKYAKHQKIFVLYLFLLIIAFVILPLIKISPVNGGAYSVRLLGGHLFKSMLVIFVTIIILLARNLSFRFKNFVISYFGFKENDSLLNFILLRIILTALLGISDTINVVNGVTQTIHLTGSYYFIQLLLLIGFVLTLISVVKNARENGNRTKIINMADEETLKEISNKRSFKGLFEEENRNEEENSD
ncbi:MAG: hypothetical protein WC872_01865 [Candidatus Absconditabacterales bacterium]